MNIDKKIVGFKINKKSSKNKRLKDIVIEYYYDKGKIFATSPKYTNVSLEDIQKIHDKLLDYTMYNLNQDSMANSIPFLTIVEEVERIIYNG